MNVLCLNNLITPPCAKVTIRRRNHSHIHRLAKYLLEGEKKRVKEHRLRTTISLRYGS